MNLIALGCDARRFTAAVALLLFGGPAISQVNGFPVIGLLATDAGGCHLEAFHTGLRKQGFVVNKNFRLECRHASGRAEDLDRAATELLATRPRVVVALSDPAAHVAKRVARNVPVVALMSADPVAVGLVQSLGRPGGNLTGVTDGSREASLKRLELLKTTVPGLRQLALLLPETLATDVASAFRRDAEAAGRTLGFGVRTFVHGNPEGLNAVFEEMRRSGVQAALAIAGRAEEAAAYRRLTELSYRHRIPVMHTKKEFVEAGGLMSFGLSDAVLNERVAIYVDRVLSGANPAELPVETPSRYELYVNSAAAKALGLLLPESLLLRAERVFE